jgi:hypothetical protein
MKRKGPILLFVNFIFIVCAFPLAASARTYFQDTFGINNPSKQMELINEQDLAGLNLSWISDAVARSKIEYEEDEEVKYDWTVLDEMLDVYVEALDMHLWLVVNPLTVIKTAGTKNYKGKYLPVRGEALDLYAAYLRRLVRHANNYKTGFRVSYWSIYNEPHAPYLSAFGRTEEDIDKGAKAYVRLVKKTYNIIKTLDPGAQVVLGGVGAGTKAPGYQFYHKVLEKLDALDPLRENNGYFDYFDYHDFNYFDRYKTNLRGYGYNWFKRELLRPHGFNGKVIVIMAGATYTGKDLDEPRNRIKRYQSESEQAEYAIKRAIFNYSKGAQNVQWGSLREHDLFEGTPHSLFCYNGFIYNGTPIGDEEWFDPLKHIADPKIIINEEPTDPNLYTFTTAIFREDTGWDYKSSTRTWEELERALSPEQQDELLTNGTIEISDGIKKLSYYTYKFMVEQLRDCDLRQIQRFRQNDDGDNFYLYEFRHAHGGPIYVAWWDWFRETDLADKTTTFHLNLPTPDSPVKITKAVPAAESGADAEIFLGQYPNFFPSNTDLSVANDVVVTLDRIPIYIEPF